MLKSYFLIALRNFKRNKFYTLLNIFGLVSGLLVSGFLILYILDEVSFDKHHENHKQIYRLESHFKIGDKHDDFAVSAAPMGPALKLEYPEVVDFTRFARTGDLLLEYGDQSFYETDVYFTDSSVLEMFSHPFLLGDPENALTEPRSMVLCESLAKKLFGDKNPIGELVQVDNDMTFKVTGVIEDLPGNSHLKFKGLLSLSTIAEMRGEEEFNSMEPGRFWNVGVYTYIQLDKNADIQALTDKFDPFYEKYMKSIGDQLNADFKAGYTALADVHHGAPLSSDLPKGNKAYIWIFSLVVVFILSLASINYMNLATARSSRRAREVGVRKVAGAVNGQIRRQFLNESVIIALFAFLISMLLMELLLPEFNHLSGKNLHFGLLHSFDVIFIMLGITLITGLLAGTYPAFYLASFQPVEVLKGRQSTGGRSGNLRKVLVVLQFVIAIVMITGTLVVNKQLRHFQEADQGFTKDNLIIATIQDTAFRRKMPEFNKILLQNPNIEGVSSSSSVPGNLRSIVVMRAEQQDGMKELALNFFMADTAFLDLYNIKLLKGRNFRGNGPEAADITQAVIINEAAAKKLGWHDDALGKRIDFGIDLEGNVERPTKVIGVVKDFNYSSLHNPVDPLVIFLSRQPTFFVSIRLNGKNLKNTIQFVEEKWNAFNKSHPFDYDFLSDSLGEMYQSEQKLSQIFNVATLFSIFIALLGLLGLASFMAEQRTREIAIRKVMGAGIGQIFQLLYRDFAVLIVVAFVISVPIAWLSLTYWLDQFASHTTISIDLFLISGLLSLLITMLSISWHIYHAATSNPADAIRTE